MTLQKTFVGVAAVSVVAWFAGLMLFMNVVPLPADGKGALGQVTGLEVTGKSSTTVHLQWTDQFAGLSDSSTVKYLYRIRLMNTDGEVIRTIETRDNEHVIKNLNANRSYRVQVRALVTYRYPWSDLLKFRTES